MFSKYTPLIAVIVVASVMGYITENIWITSIGFGSLITLFMNSIFPKIGELAIELCVKGSAKVIWLICLLLVVDFFYEIQYMVKNKNIHKVWKINLRGRWIDRQGHGHQYILSVIQLKNWQEE